MNSDDIATIQAMARYGGSFVICLAKAAQCADETNLQKIKDTWPEYWKTYSEMAKAEYRTEYPKNWTCDCGRHY